MKFLSNVNFVKNYVIYFDTNFTNASNSLELVFYQDEIFETKIGTANLYYPNHEDKLDKLDNF